MDRDDRNQRSRPIIKNLNQEGFYLRGCRERPLALWHASWFSNLNPRIHGLFPLGAGVNLMFRALSIPKPCGRCPAER